MRSHHRSGYPSGGLLHSEPSVWTIRRGMVRECRHSDRSWRPIPGSSSGIRHLGVWSAFIVANRPTTARNSDSLTPVETNRPRLQLTIRQYPGESRAIAGRDSNPLGLVIRQCWLGVCLRTGTPATCCTHVARRVACFPPRCQRSYATERNRTSNLNTCQARALPLSYGCGCGQPKPRPLSGTAHPGATDRMISDPRGDAIIGSWRVYTPGIVFSSISKRACAEMFEPVLLTTRNRTSVFGR